MKMLSVSTFAVGAIATLATAAAVAAPGVIADYANYRAAVSAARDMFQHQPTNALVEKYGLDLLSVTWEDTGRYQGSSVGPNISDMTIQVHTVRDDGKIEPMSMPVIRHGNFSDKTADIPTDKITVLVGNEKGKKLKAVSLSQYLGNFRKYLSNSKSWAGSEKSLLSPRDTHVLVSPQISFLPIPKEGEAKFNPVLFNYQSSEKNPAVLAILATREGTSATIIDNKRDAFEETGLSGQRLFFNANGQRASLTGKRASDFAAEGGSSSDVVASASGQSGLNMVMLIQVPLKHKASARGPIAYAMESTSVPRSAGIEDAVIGHGEIEGPFTEIDGLKIERDHRFPIRVTVQFYKGTDKSDISEQEIQDLKRQIDNVFKGADYVGSLVTEGTTLRPTSHNVKCEYPIWWTRPIWPIKLANGEQISREKAEEFIQTQVTTPAGYGYWYWCNWFVNPEPQPFAWALEMAKTGKFEVPAAPVEQN